MWHVWWGGAVHTGVSKGNLKDRDHLEDSDIPVRTVLEWSCSYDDGSSGTDDLTVGEVIGSECSDNESDDVQFATASSAPSALSATFMWEGMTNYVGQKEQFVDNCGPQNEAQNETECAKVFKMFFGDELVELVEPLQKSAGRALTALIWLRLGKICRLFYIR